MQGPLKIRGKEANGCPADEKRRNVLAKGRFVLSVRDCSRIVFICRGIERLLRGRGGLLGRESCRDQGERLLTGGRTAGSRGRVNFGDQVGEIDELLG